jgi:L-ascorbate metabolism protein UlaG (beta-lactamase superfamily)
MIPDMRITKYTHACVRLEHESRVLVIDPGVWTEPEAAEGADAVLVTHEHADHVDVARLARLRVPIYAPETAVIEGLDLVRVASGQDFSAAGFTVRAVGGRHAEIFGGQPDCANLGYVVAESLYHPGDSLHVPDVPVETLLVPGQGSWFKMGEAIDFVRAIRPDRSFPIHDGQVNERGLESINGWLGEETGPGYRYLAPGESL